MQLPKWASNLLAGHLAHVITAVITAVLAVGLTVVIDDNGPDHRTVTVHVGKTATVAPAAAGDLSPDVPTGTDVSKPAAQSSLRDDTPPEVPANVLAAGRAQTRHLAEQENVSKTPLPVGGAQGYSVTQDFHAHLYSDFYPSITPPEVCNHYTVSPNYKGWGDVNSVADGFARTRAASSTYIIDFEAHIKQLAPLSKKSWAAGSFNPYCRASIELIATGYETRAQWLASPLFKRHVLASLESDIMTRYRIPKRFVDPFGCTAPGGWTDHNHIECGNDHLDLSPRCAFNNANNGKALYPAYTPLHCTGFPFDVFERQLREGPRLPIRKRDRRRCAHVYHWRTHGRPARWKSANDRRVVLLHKRGLKCYRGKPSYRT